MPRPPLKRRRPNSFGSRKRVNIPDQSQARQTLERKVANKPLGKKQGDSDDSDGLVTTRTSGRNRKQQELYASGAIGKGDKPGSYPTRSQARQTLRADTDEILSQRSRSTSRTTTPAPNSEDGNATTRTTSFVASKTASSQKHNSKDASVLVNSTQPISQPEVSVLGNIKPRKRQASILRLIENDPNESSILNSDDEDQFLPDAISTPVTTANNVKTPGTKSTTTSLKRKRGSEAKQPAKILDSSPGHAPDRIEETPPRSTSSKIAPPSRTQQHKLQQPDARLESMNDIMALPESSDEDDIEQEQPDRTAKCQAIVAPSTSQLQSLMPSKKHLKLRQRPTRDEFDISENSAQNSDAHEQDDEENSVFVPSKSRKAQKRPKDSSKSGGKKDKIVKKTKDQTKSTNAPSHTPSSVRIRTPLPLSSKNNGNTQAKSPSKQGTAMLEKAVNTPSKSKAVRGAKKQYGGSHRRAAGKENEPISQSDVVSSDESGDRNGTKKTHSTPLAADAKAWNRKWADIDDFSLDFEETSVSTRSSSPNAR